jgi:branched-chain amino acid transport system substrate-binding protein
MNKTTKTILWVVVAIIVVAWIWYGVNKKPQAPVSKEPIKIGVLADLSGDLASLLRGAHRGSELAVEDLKNQIDREIKLIIEDQKSCDPKETVTIMNKFVGVDKVDVIIGGTCSNTTLAAAPIANQSKTIMISPASSAPSITKAGEYVFRTYISDALRAKEIARLAYELNKRKMAILTDINNDATIEGTKNSKEKFTESGGVVVIEEEIKKTDTDFRTQLTKIKNAKPDVLLLSISSPNQIALVLKQAKEIGLDVLFVSPFETIEDPNVIKVAGEAAEGVIYVMPGNPPETQEYKRLQEMYKQKYGEDIPSFVAESYDAVMLGVKAVLASNGTKEDIKNKLFDVSKTYTGVSGNVTFDENGDVVKDVMFKTIKNGQFVPYNK